ncbi:nicotinate-nucleotide adenylyltransferase [Prosthecomicrobium pneumaticum]|uniref:Probable nicotinate-nucleotide adenylyltransferase n=1 Tax=Prosthecomicrobium pneumaticum TaxID=81895 RepID=A0A7W9FMU6_9HYPH|nr:nicotinate-nucleotide adenylyltransferase [Prosthecomicrobium pneumaticum]
MTKPAGAAPAAVPARALALPKASPGQRIGLFGGSFDPPHDGHRLASLAALRRLRLDAVWWLVTPGNPLKARAPADLARRIAAAEALARHPRIRVTGAEASLATRYTADTLSRIVAMRPGVRFVWLMGADNLAQFHRWRDWGKIAALMPVAVYDRPGSTFSAPNAPAARLLAAYRVPERSAAAFAGRRPPAFIFLHGPRSPLSSTALRATEKSPRAAS